MDAAPAEPAIIAVAVAGDGLFTIVGGVTIWVAEAELGPVTGAVALVALPARLSSAGRWCGRVDGAAVAAMPDLVSTAVAPSA